MRRVAVTILALGLAGCGASGAASPAATSTTEAIAKLPIVDVPGTAACQNEALTIEAAESAWSTLHDGLAPLDQLVAERYLRAAPVYYRAIRAGAPAGGYTLVGTVGKCGDWPVGRAGQ